MVQSPSRQPIHMTDAFSYQDTGGGGPPVLFLHGNLSRGSHWAPQPEALGDELRCIAPDQTRLRPVDPRAVADVASGLPTTR
jgi:pimeloyl-ACP methyl ester carboxylesterase